MKSGQAVIDDAQFFYDTCIRHLQKPPVQSDKCQHHILTFELHKKIAKRPSTIQLVGDMISFIVLTVINHAFPSLMLIG